MDILISFSIFFISATIIAFIFLLMFIFFENKKYALIIWFLLIWMIYYVLSIYDFSISYILSDIDSIFKYIYNIIKKYLSI